MTEKTQAERVTFWTTGYNYWKAKMGGDVPKEFGDPQAFEDSPVAGFFRKGIYHKEKDKRAKRIGWVPVAVFKDPSAGAMVAVLDGKPVDGDELRQIWTHISGNPISEDWYRRVAEKGEAWPDSHEADNLAQAMTADDIIRHPAPAGAKGTLPENIIADKLTECEALLPKYATIESDEQASKARSLQNRFLDLRSEAGKNYDAANRPLLDAQKALREVWFPLRDKADAASGQLRAAMGKWEDTKREAARRAAEETRKRQEQADRDAQFEKSKLGMVHNEPAPPVEPVKPNTPPPAAQIRGGAGRAASVRVEVVVTDIDVMKVAEQFKDSPQLREFLMAMAQKAIRAGIPVPGATTEERSIVR